MLIGIMPAIDYTKFKSALTRLEQRYIDYLNNQEGAPEYIREALQESCIQRFEVCLDTSWKHLKKYLQEVEKMTDIPASPNGVFRKAFVALVITDVEKWMNFNDKRIATSHDYDASKASETFEVIADFISEAIALYEKISGERWQS
jgi:nucleotidyltransferase substrate binding protein (TIGR01987 family)